MKLYTYDLETYPNCFLFCGRMFDNHDKEVFRIFEISDRMNEREQLLQYLSWLEAHTDLYMVGFNNLNFDYPIIHELMTKPYDFTAMTAYLKAQDIIKQTYGKFGGTIRASDRKIPQIDLSKINHFDNDAKRVSLKSLQFAMRSASVEDLPIAPGTHLTFPQMDLLREYNVHDVAETQKFLEKNLHLIKLRQELLDNGTINGDVLNYDDTKIGKEYLTKKIGRSKCFVSGSKPKQTFREFVRYNEVILPKIYFRTEPFQEMFDWFKAQTIWIKKDERPKLKTKLAGLDFVFGVGGVHASVEGKRYESSDTHSIIDIDVAGMYVAVAISNGFSPEHLGKDFTTAYRQLQRDRAQYPKGSTMNAVLKLAGNGVYGNSNNPYSCFYDPKYTFTVTLNGQLQLAQLAEVLSLIPGLELIQANTDGITAYVPKRNLDWFHTLCREWERETLLTLEEVEYKSMYIRDVNSYIAVTTKGKVKRKGAYWWPEKDSDYEGVWHKDFSNIASIKAADQAMRTGRKIEDIIYALSDPFDFMLRYKTPGGSKVYIGDEEMLKTVRYYITSNGLPMKKIAGARGPVGQYKRANKTPQDVYDAFTKENGVGKHDPTIHTKNKSKYEEVVTRIETGWLVRSCNRAEKFRWSDVDYNYYIAEAKKLVIGE